jgi:hypothetical protein
VSSARIFRFTALGAIAVVAIVGSRGVSIPALVLMLGPGIAVPLGLALTLDRTTLPQRILASAAPLAAAVGILGWLAPPGDPKAIATASIYAVTCAVAGIVGLGRSWSRRRQRFGPLPEIAVDVGLLLLPVAGVWLLASRSAMPLIGFEEPVVTFTAAHFHFAGFAAPTIIGGVGRLVGEQSLRYRIAAVAICLGVPLTAIGIATNHTVEATAAVLLACGMLVAATVLVFDASRKAWSHGAKLGGVLFVFAGTTLLLTMTLAATFALTSSAGRGSALTGAVPLQTMIDWHGGANALGFALPALAALTLVALRREATGQFGGQI